MSVVFSCVISHDLRQSLVPLSTIHMFLCLCIAGMVHVQAEGGVCIHWSCRCGCVLQMNQWYQQNQVSLSSGHDVVVYCRRPSGTSRTRRLHPPVMSLWCCIPGDPVVPAEAGVCIHRLDVVVVYFRRPNTSRTGCLYISIMTLSLCIPGDSVVPAEPGVCIHQL